MCKNEPSPAGESVRFKRSDNQSGLNRSGSWLSDDDILQHAGLEVRNKEITVLR